MSCFLTLLLTISTSLFAQTERAGISGRITDPNGAVVPHAVVEAIQNDTNVKTTTETNADGLYYLAALRPGSYRIVVSKDGFQQVIQANVLLHVQDELTLNFALRIGSVNETVTITAEPQLMNTTDAAVSTVIDRQFVANLPLNGRSFNMLLQLTPGVIIAPLSTSNLNNLGGDAPGQFSVGGQRSNANNFTVDGVSANFGTSPTVNLGQSGLGGLQAMSAVGGTSSLVSVDALEEFRIETSSFSPEFGRSPGGQVLLTTRSGTNQFHGGVFEYFRNNVFDAGDWFVNAKGLQQAPERHNDFGGFLGGPIWKDKTFFFFSYEGARLRLPNSNVNTVPSMFARSSAPAALAPFLNGFPLPNGQPASPTALTAPFTAVWSNQATLDAASLRIDHNISDRFSVFARYNYAPSQLATRQSKLTSSVDSVPGNVQTGTAGINMFFGRVSNTVRANYSTQGAGTSYRLDTFGGAIPPSTSLFFGTTPGEASFVSFNFGDVGALFNGPRAKNRTKQFNVVDTLATTARSHALKFGVDYRLIDFDSKISQYDLTYSVPNVAQFLNTGMGRLTVQTARNGQARSQALSLFAQDTWKINARLTATYGLRWELAPAPTALSGTVLPAFGNTNNPAQIAVEPAGTPLWETTYGNFAPRVGLAYRLTDSGDLVLRAGAGVFYDLGAGTASELITGWPNGGSMFNSSVPLPISSLTPYLPSPTTLQPPYQGSTGIFNGFVSDLKLPRSYQWNLALEKSFAGRQVVSATYAGQSGSDLLRSEALVSPNANFPPFTELELIDNSAHSSWQALELQYRRPLTKRLQALFNYTWSHSIDNASSDNVAFFSNTLVPLATKGDKGNSDFDVRHSFSGAVTYSLPSPRTFRPLRYLAQDWSLDGIIVARSGVPFNAVLLFEGPDPSGITLSRPDRVTGQPVWVSTPSAPGGKMLNVNAFAVPSPIRQGTEGRNDIPGFGLTQVDLSIGRKFPFTERFNLQFRADAFNVLNHPNFTNPRGLYELGPTDLQSSMMLNQGLGGLNPLFQEGGPRSLQLSLKLTF
jgi:hypothetical protein